ncbi:DEAD/DEAH box helicase family protein [Lacrimispora sp.]|uniref:DEAD/DEAH box helicase family protein n=1 Tax=Lacrimispora sp. TaxID=2719234 RepID=UPI002899F896|nr:DEAD/DEAH box helicase family protein [Lacrimispora sp.]
MVDLPKVKSCLNTSEEDLVRVLYEPCLLWAERYDRGVGYFSSGWLSYNLRGISGFVSRKGKMRFITSPILSESDHEVIVCCTEEKEVFKLFNKTLENNLDKLEKEMQKDLLNTFAWLLHDGIIDMKFAIPRNRLNGGDFHDKFGIFYKGEHRLSFSGSLNDSMHGFLNYESIKVFKSWAGSRDYVDSDCDRFECLWKNNDINLKVYSIPEGIRERIFKLRSDKRPYEFSYEKNNQWIHQDVAVDTFFEKKNGILEMATGTGKTITAIKIIEKLFEQKKILRVVIIIAGNDLLDQWAVQLRNHLSDKPLYSNYGIKKELNKYILHPDNTILLIGKDAENLAKLLNLWEKKDYNFIEKTLFIFDEVHRAGSPAMVNNLSGKFRNYTYRLGLSATPEREYDEDGNNFIQNEIGQVIFSFTVEDAIRKGILCPFNYIPLNYELTNEEKQKKKSIIANFNAKKKIGDPVSETDMYTQLALVNKTAELKLVEFGRLLSKSARYLQRCIIFVQTKEYGEKVQYILQKYIDRYHTYYADDEQEKLERFAKGELDCLLTCKKLTEGIDISSVTNIILFSSDRSRLEVIQRIGRALRTDKKNSDKVANVIDFILQSDKAGEDETSDTIRQDWLTRLSKVRKM